MTSRITYTCDECGVEIPGRTWDPQEAPELMCPECGDQMDRHVEWDAL